MLGAGTMGSGIAQVFAQAGDTVRLIEVSPSQLERGVAAIQTNLARAVEKGRLSADEQNAVSGRILASSELGDADHADLVVEAIHESLGAKLEVFRLLDATCPPETILASNTSSISITTLGAATARADQVIGMHFFNPAPVMKLVEVVHTVGTADDVLATARQVCERLGKHPVVCRDRSGFVVNALLFPYLNNAVRMLEQGTASKEDIDTAMQGGCNFPMGPFALLDLVGLDTSLSILEALYDESREPNYAAVPTLRRMVAAGKLGRKSGEGFYRY